MSIKHNRVTRDSSSKPKIMKRLTTLLLLYGLQVVSADLFTAVVDMEDLLGTESLLISELEQYITLQEEKLNFLKSKTFDYKKEHADAARDVTNYLSNPLNAYLLTKRLTVDWKEIEDVLGKSFESETIFNISRFREELKFPTDEDLNGAAVALMRLQDTYNLDTARLAQGELNGVKYSSQLSAKDCFELGRQSYVNHDYYHTMLWMQEALNQLDFKQNQTLAKEEVLEYLAFATFKQGNVNLALHLTNELLEIVPNHERAAGNKVYYEKEISKNNANQNVVRKGDDESKDIPVAYYEALLAHKVKPSVYDASERKIYELMCRGDFKKTSHELSQLHCYHKNGPSSFLTIAPLKVEEANLDPYIIVYHEVMFDREIEIIKKLAKPRFRRATVQNHKTGELEVAHYRISKSSWLKDDEDPVVKTISVRLQDMTDLAMDTAEDLQVVNYGIGGHYEPHYDFARKEEKNAFQSLGTGNRIATVLFYMSDVSQGGATVFPHIRTALWPKKGTAAFWYNLYKDGEGNYLTRHAACPVLAGTKWVSNRWIHERGQEFLRPCGVHEDSSK